MSKRTFKIEIKEIRRKAILIEAESEKEAVAEARKRYLNGEYTIDRGGIVAAEFETENK